MQLQFVGCGDAFGSGGRNHTCLHLSATGLDMLVDCGATAFPAIERAGIDRNAVTTILLTHFHGDHFGGLPYFLLEAHYRSGRKAPLTIAGPPGVEAAVSRLVDASYPGLMAAPRRYEIRWVEIRPGETVDLPGARATAFPVIHDHRLAHCFGYRLEAEGKVFAFSGDTTWTDTLIPLAADADLFVVECYVRAGKVAVHVDYATLMLHLPAITAKRIVLTHMSSDMLDHADEIALEMAEDGLTIAI